MDEKAHLSDAESQNNENQLKRPSDDPQRSRRPHVCHVSPAAPNLTMETDAQSSD